MHWHVDVNLLSPMEEKEIQNRPDCPSLDLIKCEKKIYEGRLKCKIDEWKLLVGKQIKFYDKDNSQSYVICEVTSLVCFNDFGMAFDALGDKLMPFKTRIEVIDLYNKLFDDSDKKLFNETTFEMIQRIGVVAIGLKVIFSQ
jgi:hypothetical protein